MAPLNIGGGVRSGTVDIAVRVASRGARAIHLISSPPVPCSHPQHEPPSNERVPSAIARCLCDECGSRRTLAAVLPAERRHHARADSDQLTTSVLVLVEHDVSSQILDSAGLCGRTPGLLTI